MLAIRNVRPGFLLCATLALLFAGCGGSTSSTSTGTAAPQTNTGGGNAGTAGASGGELTVVATGVWGGTDSALNVTSSGATFRWSSCNTGQVTQPLATDANGQFDVPGTITAAHGGPVRPSDTVPARYRGQVSGDKMSLEVDWTDAQGAAQSFSDQLEHGFEGPLPWPCPL